MSKPNLNLLEDIDSDDHHDPVQGVIDISDDDNLPDMEDA